jgi:hypothetical protein
MKSTKSQSLAGQKRMFIPGLPCMALIGLIPCVFLALQGCVATHTAIKKNDLEVTTRIDKTIFLEPVAPSKKLLYLQVRNTSGKTDFDIEKPIQEALKEKHYQIIEDPDRAQFWLRVNVLRLEKSTLSAAESALKSGYGGGNIFEGLTTHRLASKFSALTENFMNSMVDEVTYMAITDIELAERLPHKAGQNQEVILHTGGVETYEEDFSNQPMKKYQIRVVGTATKANLEMEEATGPLSDDFANVLAGLF